MHHFLKSFTYGHVPILNCAYKKLCRSFPIIKLLKCSLFAVTLDMRVTATFGARFRTLNYSLIRKHTLSVLPGRNSSSTTGNGENRLKVAIVGRPNVGKSTLFNRIVGSRMAIVSDIPGTTRDRKESKAFLGGIELLLCDTGGLDDGSTVSASIQHQVEQAIKSSDVILFVVDSKSGITPVDEHYARWLRRKIGQLTDKSKVDETFITKDIFLLANKTEGEKVSDKMLDTFSDCLRLGLGDPMPISASHGDGMADIILAILQAANKRGIKETTTNSYTPGEPIALEDRTIQLAIMGRPNVGKSTLLNSVLGDERVIVGPTPGLTRLALKCVYDFFNQY